jgi:anti-sigma factor RsiW
MSHDHADTAAADALDALQSRFDAQEAELMRLTALVDSLVQSNAESTAAIKELASSPALAVTHARFARDQQAFKDEAARSANAEAEKTLQVERKAAYARQQADVRHQVGVELRQHRSFWIAGSFLAGLAAAWMCATYLQGGTRLAIWATGEPNGWEAGSHLMRSADPAGWNKLADLWTVVQQQEAAARACKDANVVGINAAACAVTLPKPVKPR